VWGSGDLRRSLQSPALDFLLLVPPLLQLVQRLELPLQVCLIAVELIAVSDQESRRPESHGRTTSQPDSVIVRSVLS
jgi:hypothetical protein